MLGTACDSRRCAVLGAATDVVTQTARSIGHGALRFRGRVYAWSRCSPSRAGRSLVPGRCLAPRHAATADGLSAAVLLLHCGTVQRGDPWRSPESDPRVLLIDMSPVTAGMLSA